ncbi:MAG: hypothetical protein GY936_11610 [Ignavibacteriae bacterium]|nr:hypothetical protein [Ignavibacteriota bacterium]
MKKYFALSLFLLVSFTSVYSQEIFFCESYMEDGTPVGPTNQLSIKPWGTAIYILLDNNKTPFNELLLNVFVDKKNGDKYSPFESKTIEVDAKGTWAVTNFEFNEVGTYQIYFLNASQKIIAVNILKVNFAEGVLVSSNPHTTVSDGSVEMLFCQMVINDKPINSFDNLSISRTGGRAIIYLNNYSPFETEILTMQVWRKNIEESDFGEFVAKKRYQLLPEWNETFIKYRFDQSGEYKFDIFNREETLISSNTIVVTN